MSPPLHRNEVVSQQLSTAGTPESRSLTTVRCQSEQRGGMSGGLLTRVITVMSQLPLAVLAVRRFVHEQWFSLLTVT